MLGVMVTLLTLCVLYGVFAISIGVIASQCLALVQDTEAGRKLKMLAAMRRPSRIIPNLFGDGHPMDSRVWFALRDSHDLPAVVQRKAGIIGWLYRLERVTFVAAFGTILLNWLITR